MTNTINIEELRILKAKHREGATIAKEKLQNRRIEINTLRFKDGLTLQAIGNKFGLTRERVRQILNQPL